MSKQRPMTNGQLLKLAKSFGATEADVLYCARQAPPADKQALRTLIKALRNDGADGGPMGAA